MFALRDFAPLGLRFGGEAFEKLLVNSTTDGGMLLLLGLELFNSLCEDGVNFGAVFWTPYVVSCSPARQLQLDAEELCGDGRNRILCCLIEVGLGVLDP